MRLNPVIRTGFKTLVALGILLTLLLAGGAPGDFTGRPAESLPTPTPTQTS
jgi:hypothetical protein